MMKCDALSIVLYYYVFFVIDMRHFFYHKLNCICRSKFFICWYAEIIWWWLGRFNSRVH